MFASPLGESGGDAEKRAKHGVLGKKREHEDDGAVVVPISDIRAVRMLQDAGLVPQIRHRSTRVS